MHACMNLVLRLSVSGRLTKVQWDLGFQLSFQHFNRPHNTKGLTASQRVSKGLIGNGAAEVKSSRGPGALAMTRFSSQSLCVDVSGPRGRKDRRHVPLHLHKTPCSYAKPDKVCRLHKVSSHADGEAQSGVSVSISAPQL